MTRETHPEEYALMEKVFECGKRGHGKLITYPDGYKECYDCGELLGSFHRDEQLDDLDYIDWDDDAEDDVVS
jgi:hypothetical protein